MAAIVGNGLGAWNIRTISSRRLFATGVLTFLSAVVSGTVGRFIARNEWIFVMAWAIGSVIGIVGVTYLDHKYFHQDFKIK